MKQIWFWINNRWLATAVAFSETHDCLWAVDPLFDEKPFLLSMIDKEQGKIVPPPDNITEARQIHEWMIGTWNVTDDMAPSDPMPDGVTWEQWRGVMAILEDLSDEMVWMWKRGLSHHGLTDLHLPK